MPVHLYEQLQGRVLVVHATGKISRDDYQWYVPKVEELIRRHGKIRVLFEMEDFQGWRADALWEDIKFELKHYDDIERLAIVGEKRWHSIMSQLCSALTGAEINYYSQDQVEEALCWVRAPWSECARPPQLALPSATAKRAPDRIRADFNGQIRRVAEKSVTHCALIGPEAIEDRLEVLDREWHLEPTLEIQAGLVVLLGLGLGVAGDRRWYLLPAIAAGCLLQYAVSGWCPAMSLFRRLGYRRTREVEEERYALKALRGDFARLPAKAAGAHAHGAMALEAARQ